MKQLWSILMDKVKQLEPNVAALGIGITILFALGMATKVIIAFVNMIVSIVTSVTAVG